MDPLGRAPLKLLDQFSKTTPAADTKTFVTRTASIQTVSVDKLSSLLDIHIPGHF
jgi:hypothetical protein